MLARVGRFPPIKPLDPVMCPLCLDVQKPQVLFDTLTQCLFAPAPVLWSCNLNTSASSQSSLPFCSRCPNHLEHRVWKAKYRVWKFVYVYLAFLQYGSWQRQLIFAIIAMVIVAFDSVSDLFVRYSTTNRNTLNQFHLIGPSRSDHTCKLGNSYEPKELTVFLERYHFPL